MVAVVAQQSAVVRRYVEDNGLPFYVLIDQSREVTKQYGVWHRLGLDAWNIARPAIFLVEQDGRISYSFIGDNQREYPSQDEILSSLPRP